MADNQAHSPEEKFEILKLIFQDQRNEMSYRREREYRIFTWSSSLLLALIGALLIIKQTESLVWQLYGYEGKFIASMAVGVLAFYSISWQIRNRNFRKKNADVILGITYIFNCFEKDYFSEGETLLPKEWKKGRQKTRTFSLRFLKGNYQSATLILGILAVLMIWVS